MTVYAPKHHSPIECGKYDPPMQEWLALPVGIGPDEAVCPECGSTHFGTVNPTGYFLVRVCHDERGVSCHTRFRASANLHMLSEIANALAGFGRHF